MSVPDLYTCAGLAVLRAALAARPPEPPRDPREPADPARLRDAIRVVLDDPALAAALELASGDLARAVARPWPQIAARPPRDRRRMTLALTGYLLRLRHRATPFGLFAGTALVPVTGTAGDPAAAGSLRGRPRVLLRPSPRWLAGLVADVEADPALPAQAPLVRIAASPSLRPAGAWQLLPDREGGGPGRWQAGAAVRRSPLLDAVLTLAGPDGTGYQALLSLLDTVAPGIGRDQLAHYLSRLLAAGFLVTDLLPAPGDTDPLGHLAERLDGHPIATRLRAVRADLRPAATPAGLPAPAALLAAAELRRLRALLHDIRPRDADLVADTRLGTDLRVPRRVVREVERAASVAWTCAPPRASRPLAGLHYAMLDRYGSDRPVPLTELLDITGSLGLHPSSGSAAPPGDPRSAAPSRAGRDRMLTGLALDALTAGYAELVLRPPLRNRLGAVAGAGSGSDSDSGSDSGSDRYPPPVDVFAEVVTASAQALDQGDFLVCLGSPGHPGPAGATAGRLAAQLGAGAARLAAPADEAGPLDVELVFRPPDPAAANLVAETGWTRFRIDLTGSGPSGSGPSGAGAPGAAGPGRDIPLGDLVVIATPERLRLRSERLGRDIRPVSFSTLDPRHAGPVAGFLLALGRHGAVPWRAWDWGAAATLPWLPRVRTGRAVLAPARWVIPPGLLHLAGAGSGRQWRDGLLRWRDAHEVPDVVIAGAWDQRLPLDLADPVHAELLRRECRDRGVVTVTEPPGGLAAWRSAGWPRSPRGPHTAEFVFSLHPAARGDHALGVPPGTEERNQGHTDSAFLPGGPWLCAGLAVPEALQDGVLAELADEALQAAAGQAEVDRWFFVRGADPAGVPQLRLRFHGQAAGLNQALLPALHAWSGRLRGAGLLREFSLLSYWPEHWRYGDGACLTAAERFFHCDSRLSLELLGSGAAVPERLAAPGVMHILAVMLGSRELPRPRLSGPERRRLADLGQERHQPPVAVPSHGQGARSAWPEWYAALAAYQARLGDAGRDPVPVAWSLVHMHCNRLAGPSRATERIAIALARDLVATR